MPDTYPIAVIDQPEEQFLVLGGFWRYVYDDREHLQEYLESQALLDRQVLNNLAEAQACLNCATTPVNHLELWQEWKIRLSQRGLVPLRYAENSPVEFDPTSGITYGSSYQTGLIAWVMPADLRSVPFLCDLQIRPKTVLVDSLDYSLDFTRDLVRFASDPFLNPDLLQTPIFAADGTVADYEIRFWLYRPQLAVDFLNQHWGYVFGALDTPSESYRRILTAIQGSIVQGFGLGYLHESLCALLGNVLAQENGLIYQVETDGAWHWIFTANQAHRASSSSPLLIAQDDDVSAGDPLTAAVQIYDFKGALPTWLHTLALSPGYLALPLRSGISFPNQELPLTITVDDVTTVEFPLDGHPLEIEEFWAETRRREAAAGRTLASYLDRRELSTEPVPVESLPATLNPAQFVAANFLSVNTLAIRLETASAVAGVPWGTWSRFLPKLLPPHVSILFVLDLPTLEEGVILASGDGEDALLSAYAFPTLEDEVKAPSEDVLLGRVVSTRFS